MISYLLEVSLCWLGFYLLYFLLLSKETFFNINRLYLIVTLLLGLIVPLAAYLPDSWFHYQESSVATVYFQPIYVGVQQIEALASPAPESSNNLITKVLIGIYLAGVLFFLSRFLYGFRQIFQLYKGATIVKKADHTLVLTKSVHYPFSFFNYLFWSEVVEFDEQIDQKIISHEKAHMSGWHSMDVIFVELLCVLFWCSPLIYFYKKSIRVVHEYLADALVLKTTRKKQYGQLLLEQSQSGIQIALANHFFHSQLKKRIAMMTKHKSNRRGLVKYLSVVPLLVLFIILFTQKDLIAEKSLELFDESIPALIENEVPELDVPLEANVISFHESAKNESTVNKTLNKSKSEALDTVPRQSATIEGDIFKVVEEMPRFPGCTSDSKNIAELKACADKEMLMFVYENIAYPKSARADKIEGIVVVQFIVDKNGNVVNPKILRSIGGGCDEEVLRIVDLMPKWIPGKQRGQNVNVQFNLPVRFKIEDSKAPQINLTDVTKTMEGKTLEEVVVTALGGTNIKLKNAKEVQPLIFIDGKRHIGGLNIVDLDPNDIAEIHVLKDKKAIEYAGEEGKVGVILITTKKKAAEPQLHYETRIVTDENGNQQRIQVRVDPNKKSTGMQIPPPPPAPPTISDFVENKDGQYDQLKYLINGAKVTRTEFENRHKELYLTNYKPSEEKHPKGKGGIVNLKTLDKMTFKVVEEMPRFPGCETEGESMKQKKGCADMKMLEFIYENITYPDEARKNGIQGTSVVSFIVNTDGSLSDKKIVRSIGHGTDEVVLDIIDKMNQMPQRWIPGKQRGKAVNVQMLLPIRFKIAQEAEKDAPIYVPPVSPKNELKLQNFKAFPNPTEDQLTINFQGDKIPVTVTIMDIAGKKIFRESINDFDGTYNKTITISNAAKGTLVITVLQNNKYFISKVVHQ